MLAAAAPELPAACKLAAAAIAAITAWRPGPGLLLVAGLAPAGALFAPAPARAAELFAWAFLTAWLLCAWRPLARSGWPRGIAFPVCLYGAAVIASWLTMAVSGAGGVSPAALPQFLFQSIPRDHLIFSSPEPETWTFLQIATGMAILLAAAGTVRDDPRLLRPLAWAIAASTAILAVATLADVARQWAQAGFGGWFLLRYVRGEQFSLHLQDMNAAGSLYVLAALTATALAFFDRERRARWIVLLSLMIPALWLTGSRSSFVALLGGLLALAAAQRLWQPTRTQLTAGASLLVAMLLAAALLSDWRTDVRGSAGQAASLRWQFTQTTTRMITSAPIFGVGVGRYFNRSPEFMSEELRALYGNENAHNYFAQQFAELGMVGGVLFIWLVATGVARAWARLRQSENDGAAMGLAAGAVSYLLTCLTGHPLLVPEAALPFWIVFGAVTCLGARDGTASRLHRVIAVLAVAVLMAGAALGAAPYRQPLGAPKDQGFHGLETGPDGARFRWMTRHGVTYVPDGPGFLRLRVHAPARRHERPLVLETSIAGRVLDRREIPQGLWSTYDIAVRQPGPAPFRRVDLRANQVWMEEVKLGRRAAQRPISVMVAETSWIPIR
jgi:O-antigen ligase